MVQTSSSTVCDGITTDVERGVDAEANASLIVALKAQNECAVRMQRCMVVVTVAAILVSLAAVLHSLRAGSSVGYERGSSASLGREAVLRLAAEWQAYNVVWEECAKKPDCDPWNTTEANLLIERTRASIPDPDKINGVAPPGVAGMSTGSPGQPWSEKPTHTMLEYVGRQPIEVGTSTMYAVWYNSRRVMERTPIHVHPETQFTCVLNGTLMFIAEGMETKNYSSGQCYVMPGMTKMVSVNVGDSPYVDVDIFRVSAGSVPWIVIEPGALWMQTTQFDQRDQQNKTARSRSARIDVGIRY